MIHQYQVELSELITTVIEAQRGILHPSIITPGTIKEELQIISKSIPSDLILIAELKSENMFQVLNKLCYIKAFLVNEKVVIVISIPLVHNKQFALYKLHPLPLHDKDNVFISSVWLRDLRAFVSG